MARLQLVALLLPLLSLGGCRVALVDPQPLRGPAPERVAVWPSVDRAFAADEAALLAGLDLAVRARGYRTVALAVGRELLIEAGLWQPHAAPPRDFTAAGIALGVDAVLVLEVRGFDAPDGELTRADWDLSWRLRSTRGGGVLWDYSHHGSWNRSDEHRPDALQRLDAEPEVVPVGGSPGFSFRSRGDLAANLHRLALAHLPRAR